jgi:hypothetical protein
MGVHGRPWHCLGTLEEPGKVSAAGVSLNSAIPSHAHQGTIPIEPGNSLPTLYLVCYQAGGY